MRIHNRFRPNMKTLRDKLKEAFNHLYCDWLDARPHHIDQEAYEKLFRQMFIEWYEK